MSKKKTYELSERQTRNRRKKRELAFFLPAIGGLLYLTPLMNAVSATENPPAADISDLFFFIFGSWALLIIGAYFLSRNLADEVNEE